MNKIENSHVNTIERIRRTLTWMERFVSGEGLSEEAKTYMVQDNINDDLNFFIEVMKHEKWRKATNSEISLIKK